LIGDQAIRKVARTLYHGTTVDNEASIRQVGLVGGIGGFTEWAYREYIDAGEELPNLVFAADKGGLKKSVGAMVHHIGDKLGKNFHKVTDNDILNHGLLVIIHDEENRIEQRPEEDENYYGQYPSHVEPGDYFAEELIPDKFVKGRALLRLLERYGQWPRTYGPESAEPSRLNKMRGELIARWLRENPERTKQEAMNLVRGLPDNKVVQYFRQYIGGD
jgi:hypothetical protein